MQHTKELLIKGIKSGIITTDMSKSSCPNEKGLRSKQSGASEGKKPVGLLLGYLSLSLKNCPLKDKDILVITSKVVAVTQGRVRKISSTEDFNNLVKSEADAVLGGKQVTLTLKDGIFIPWAGIDRSNIQQGMAVLWPKNPFGVASEIQKALRKKYHIKNLGIIITDSHCIPLRKGVIALALGYAGFRGINDLRGKKDLYGNKLKVTQQNVSDMLATAAHLVMGESDEGMPFALIKNAPVSFTNSKINRKEPIIDPGSCLFSPLYPTSVVGQQRLLKTLTIRGKSPK